MLSDDVAGAEEAGILRLLLGWPQVVSRAPLDVRKPPMGARPCGSGPPRPPGRARHGWLLPFTEIYAATTIHLLWRMTVPQRFF